MEAKKSGKQAGWQAGRQGGRLRDSLAEPQADDTTFLVFPTSQRTASMACMDNLHAWRVSTQYAPISSFVISARWL
eukprot:1160630-Pelagomonas_calceolata.AAC.5